VTWASRFPLDVSKKAKCYKWRITLGLPAITFSSTYHAAPIHSLYILVEVHRLSIYLSNDLFTNPATGKHRVGAVLDISHRLKIDHCIDLGSTLCIVHLEHLLVLRVCYLIVKLFISFVVALTLWHHKMNEFTKRLFFLPFTHRNGS
jgi:hypothetical protein